jgi:hypothetical protein
MYEGWTSLLMTDTTVKQKSSIGELHIIISTYFNFMLNS